MKFRNENSDNADMDLSKIGSVNEPMDISKRKEEFYYRFFITGNEKKYTMSGWLFELITKVSRLRATALASDNTWLNREKPMLETLMNELFSWFESVLKEEIEKLKKYKCCFCMKTFKSGMGCVRHQRNCTSKVYPNQ
jgi:hypothetical protein